MADQKQSMNHSPRNSFLSMRDRQKVLRNLVALIGLGKAVVIGSGMALALVGYVDLARHVLPSQIMNFMTTGFPPEAAAGVGGILGLLVALIVSIFR